jgi:carbamoyltransferase
MTVLGFTGWFGPTRPLPEPWRDSVMPPSRGVFHDSASVLVRNGRIVAAIEEERLTRVKHTNRIAARSIKACLEIGKISLQEVDRIAFYCNEQRLDRSIANHMLYTPHIEPRWSARAYVAQSLGRELGCDVDPSKLEFIDHHLAHAASAYLGGPFPEALVVTLDGQGDSLSGTVSIGSGGKLSRLLTIPARDSLGLMYLDTIVHLGYGLFDEYKVMGLAPYGNPAPYRELFEAVCQLRPKGRFAIDPEQLRYLLLEALPVPRRAGEPMLEAHRDLAAALQEAIERAALHLLAHFRNETGLPYLCLAGGVAHNSTLVGKIARSGLFENVFVQPAAHDAGCALGAALLVEQQLASGTVQHAMTDLYLGKDLGTPADIAAKLQDWGDLIIATESRTIEEDAARLIRDGAVIGWVQGRSEFGPRALGNRSIIADPRFESNKDRVNELVKMRESYRPFAPAVLEEYADQYFEIPPNCCAPFMTFTVPVREEMRSSLAAVTHVDGTARVQTVSRKSNLRFWKLIDAFRKETGIPVLLNTSFNHSVEPIVDSVDDAVTCLLTTGLSHLVVGDHIITKREQSAVAILDLVPVLPEYTRLVHATQRNWCGELEDTFWCEHGCIESMSRSITESCYRLLSHIGQVHTVRELLKEHSESKEGVLEQLRTLWELRTLSLVTRAVARRRSPQVKGGTDGSEHYPDGCVGNTG